MLKTVVVAEKPSVARDIAAVLGKFKSDKGFYQVEDYLVTWAIGHLVALGEPHQINPRWRSWNQADLPLLPKSWPLFVIERTRAQFDIVASLLVRDDVDQIVCATDAGREGELIFRYIYEFAKCDKPSQRLWISSLTTSAIKQGLDELRSSNLFDSLADSARARNRADWIVGMNLSRAYSLKFSGDFSVGRVQTPTLAMMVERELEIQHFVVEPYCEITATFATLTTKRDYQATLCALRDAETFTTGAISQKSLKDLNPLRFAGDGKQATAITDALATGKAQLIGLFDKTNRLAPPLLYDLTELQRSANRIFGFSAEKTLTLAQDLYEKQKLISYPRTDSRYLTSAVAAELGEIARTLHQNCYSHLPLHKDTGFTPIDKRYIDDNKVADHHAIVPTRIAASAKKLPEDLSKIYDLICRRTLAIWQEDYISATTSVVTKIAASVADDDRAVATPKVALFVARGTQVVQQGFKVIDSLNDLIITSEIPAGMQPGDDQTILTVNVAAKKTRPPARFTDASLLTAMETAGKMLEDDEFPDMMRNFGLGTPATRASILESLITRSYLQRLGKALQPTAKGIALIDKMHPEVKSPALTGMWEFKLHEIAEGKRTLGQFMDEISTMVSAIVNEIARGPHHPPLLASAETPDDHAARHAETRYAGAGAHIQGDSAAGHAAEGTTSIGSVATFNRAPVRNLHDVLLKVFGYKEFRPHQHKVCEEVIQGHDVLLVMPTGAGKSLCYQLPGVVLGGTTLVICPLIALMEDQVKKARDVGLKAETIHSGLSADSSRKVCQRYMQGDLDLLYIAPERLAVPRFVEFLARRKPALIAIDEAHCISQWGHDFRPDYRMLGEKLPALRPAPVIALTATATQVVQQDIVAQLQLQTATLHIHGFRRSNIAIEILEIPVRERMRALESLLVKNEARPAIVYAPTRKLAEAAAQHLAGGCRVEAYHAGFDAQKRSNVQTRFLDGDIDVIVATTAFGMGIDKADIRSVIHLALPSSVEAYYQEIGRAGRDGNMSRAVLFFSHDDLKTLEFFHNKNYPDIALIDEIFAKIPASGIFKSQIDAACDEETLDSVLQKLWIHGGIEYRYDEMVLRQPADWRERYSQQKEYNYQQIKLVERFAQDGSVCRMMNLLHYFGDDADQQGVCGLCDVCAPVACRAKEYHKQSAEDTAHILAIRAGLIASKSPQALGRIYRELFEDTGCPRSEFDLLLSAMARAGFASFATESFQKDGREIKYRTAAITMKGKLATRAELSVIELSSHSFAVGSRDYKPSRRAGATSRKTKSKRQEAIPPSPVAKPDTQVSLNADNLKDQLRNWRTSQAKRLKVPAFCIFPDKVLWQIADEKPQNENELLGISGIGVAKVAKFGKSILSLISGKA